MPAKTDRALILCECCAIALVNSDTSACRDYHEHTHPDLNVPAGTVVSGDCHEHTGTYALDCHGHGGTIEHGGQFYVATVLGRASLEIHDIYTVTSTHPAGGTVCHGVSDATLHTADGARVGLSLVKANGARRWDIHDMDQVWLGAVHSDGVHWWVHSPDGACVTRRDLATRDDALGVLVG